MKSKMFYCTFVAFVLSMFITLSAYSQCDDIPEPTNPDQEEICEGSPTPIISVNYPGTGFRINWYTEITEGTLLATTSGAYIPQVSLPGEYVFYAENEEIATGCKSDRIPVTLIIHPMPDVTIIPVSYFCCPGESLSFQQTISTYIVSCTWFFDGGIPSSYTMINPPHVTYNSEGIFHVYLITNSEYGCQSETIIDIWVSNFGVDITPVETPICYNTPAFNLTNPIPGGVWTGTGITDAINGTFDPSVAGVGSHTINYLLTSSPECSVNSEIIINVNDSEVYPVITAVNNLYLEDEPETLNVDIPGGIWSGTGITDSENGIFDPSLAGIGLHTITYNVEFGSCSGSAQTVINVTGINVFGYLFSDLNTNCIFDEGEEVSDRLIVAVPGPYYAYTNDSGYYKFFLNEGAYTIHAVEPAYFSVSCPEQGFQNIIVENTQDTLQNVNLGMSPDFACSLLNVDLLLEGATPCFSSHIYVNYSNTGTVTAENAYIEIELAPFMTYVSSTLPYSSFSENTYRFELNDVAPFENGEFIITFSVACDLGLLGQTCCVNATIYPNSSCETDFGNWDHSSVSVDGYCQDNLNACFSITNTGDFGEGDMQNPHEYRILANDTLVFNGTFQLLGGESTEICWATNGQAIRLEADQHPEHPGNSHPQFTVEACGENSEFSYGHITTNTYDDDPHFVDIDCQIITGSYDPNNKEVQPSGISENHYIESNTLLTYRVNFQNTGNDTAFTVVIVDTLSSQHDILSFERGICSHPCELEIYDNGILVWTFNNILLPDSAANEPESHGFVTYKVLSGNMSPTNYGEQILNNAAIYFDFNPPVITNTTSLIYWKLPLSSQGINPGLHLNLQFSIFPNPATQSFSVDVESTASAIEIFDTNGKAVMEITNYNGEQIPVSNIYKGLYFVKLISDGIISVGKLVVE